MAIVGIITLSPDCSGWSFYSKYSLPKGMQHLQKGREYVLSENICYSCHGFIENSLHKLKDLVFGHQGVTLLEIMILNKGSGDLARCHPGQTCERN